MKKKIMKMHEQKKSGRVRYSSDKLILDNDIHVKNVAKKEKETFKIPDLFFKSKKKNKNSKLIE